MAINFYVIAKRYSNALWIAGASSEAKAVASELAVVLATFKQPELWRLLAAPTFTAATKLEVASQILEKAQASKIVKRFVEHLIKAGRITALAEIVEAFEARVRESEGTLEAQVETAMPLSEKQKSEITAGLSRLLNKKITLRISEKVELVAGLRVFVAGRLMDGTLTSSIGKLEKELLSENVSSR